MKNILIVICAVLSTKALSQFDQPKELTHQSSNLNIAETADIDNDGDPDIVAVGSYGNNVVWYENDGGGNFGEMKIVSNQIPFASSLQIADLNGDTQPDLIIGFSAGPIGQPHIVSMLNLGSGMFDSPNTIYTAATDIRAVLTVDVDEDGDIDIMGAKFNTTGSIYWFANDGNGNFGTAQIFSTVTLSYCSLAAGDIDLDGDLDILAGADGTADKIIGIENLGGGSYAPYVNLAYLMNGIKSTKLYDLDNDGDLDILSASSQDDKISWNANNGTGVFGSQNIISGTLDGASWAVASDLDLDGDLDIIASASNGSKIVRFENFGAGVFSAEIVISTHTYSATSVITTDLNFDGLPDIISTSAFDDRLAWFENLGSNSFTTHKNISDTLRHANRPESVVFSDMNGDGLKDVLFVAEYDNFVGWFENLGTGNFSETRSAIYHNPAEPARYACSADFDNDGDQDIVCALYTTDKIIWFENLGTGIFGPAQIVTTLVNGVVFVFPADIDLDGDIDLFSISGLDDKIAWYENDGSGNFGPQIIVVSSCNFPRHMDYSDLDQDGLNDIVVVCMDNKTMWFKNLGSGIFGSQQIISTTSNDPYCADIADLNNDGMADVLVSSNGDGDLSWYQNTGSGVFSTETVINDMLSGQLRSEAIDLDLDGDLDILAAIENPDQFFWVENLGLGVFSPPSIISSLHQGPTWFTINDADNDGDLDFVGSSFQDDRISYFENETINEKQIKGLVFYDDNDNGIFDAGDYGINFLPIVLNPPGLYAYTFFGGEYIINPDTFGIYNISPILFPDWEITTDSSSYTVNLNSSNALIDSLNFGFHCDSIFYILNVDLIAGPHPCNQTINYWVNIMNVGTMIGVGTVELTLDDSLDFISSAFVPDSIIGQTIYWTLDSLLVFNNISFDIQVQTPDVNSLGYVMQSFLELTSNDTLGNPINFYSDSVFASITCAYDPNTKTVSPQGFTEYGFIPDTTKKLTYTIFFQNTGTDTAHNVLVEDQLTAYLDWQSIQVLGSSHAVQTFLDPDGLLSFYFPSIMLPDSNVNQIGSNGYVTFEIEIDSSASAGTEIENNVSIFFDLNPPVLTDTALVTLYNCQLEDDLIVLENFCAQDTNTIIAQFQPLMYPNNYIWQMTGVDTVANSNFTWNHTETGSQNLIFTSTNPYCSSDSTFVVTIFQTDSTYLSTMEICEQDSVFIFDSYQTSPGSYFYLYQNMNGCDSLVFVDLVVNPKPVVSITPTAEDTLCTYEGIILLEATPSGGAFFGNGVSGNSFDPSLVTIGTNEITYIYSDMAGCSNSDTITVVIDTCLSIQENSSQKFSLFPSPFTNFLYLQNVSTADGNYRISVFDLQGRILFSTDWNSSEILGINSSGWISGSYFVQVYDCDGNEPPALFQIIKL